MCGVVGGGGGCAFFVCLFYLQILFYFILIGNIYFILSEKQKAENLCMLCFLKHYLSITLLSVPPIFIVICFILKMFCSFWCNEIWSNCVFVLFSADFVHLVPFTLNCLWGPHRQDEKRCCTHIQTVYTTVAAAPRNDGKHSRVINNVVIWVALQGFLEAWQLCIKLLWRGKKEDWVILLMLFGYSSIMMSCQMSTFFM